MTLLCVTFQRLTFAIYTGSRLKPFKIDRLDDDDDDDALLLWYG